MSNCAQAAGSFGTGQSKLLVVLSIIVRATGSFMPRVAVRDRELAFALAAVQMVTVTEAPGRHVTFRPNGPTFRPWG